MDQYNKCNMLHNKITVISGHHQLLRSLGGDDAEDLKAPSLATAWAGRPGFSIESEGMTQVATNGILMAIVCVRYLYLPPPHRQEKFLMDPRILLCPCFWTHSGPGIQQNQRPFPQGGAPLDRLTAPDIHSVTWPVRSA